MDTMMVIINPKLIRVESISTWALNVNLFFLVFIKLVIKNFNLSLFPSKVFTLVGKCLLLDQHWKAQSLQVLSFLLIPLSNMLSLFVICNLLSFCDVILLRLITGLLDGHVAPFTTKLNTKYLLVSCLYYVLL